MPKKILILDDSGTTRAAASVALERAGYEVVAPDDFTDLGHLLSEELDLVLLDINLQQLYGDEALAFYREAKGMPDRPVLLYSAMEEKQVADRARRAGATGYVLKSWGLDRLVQEVQRHLA